jgi:hypothetical protein
MSLQDDVKTVYNALKGSAHPDWPKPAKDDFNGKYLPFKAFERICDQLPNFCPHPKYDPTYEEALKSVKRASNS